MKPPERQPVLSLFVERFFLPEKKGCARIRKKKKEEETAMMYIHYCKYCRRIHILNGHKLYCPACSGKLSELDISYMKYVNLSREERRALREKCADEKSLRELSVDYPRRGGAKWFQAAEPARTGRTTDNKSASRPEYSPHLRVSVS